MDDKTVKIPPKADVQNNGEMEISIPDFLTTISERKGLVILFVILGFIASFIYGQIKTPLYKSSVVVQIKPTKDSSNITDLVSGTANNVSISTEIELVKSFSTLQSALDLMDLSKYTNNEGITYDNLDLNGNVMLKRVSTSSVKDTKLVEITVQDPNPDFASDYANAVAASLQNLLSSMTRNTKTRQRETLEAQIPENIALLDNARRELLEYSNKYGTAEAKTKIEVLTGYIAAIQLLESPLMIQNTELSNSVNDIKSAYTLEDVISDSALGSIIAEYNAVVKEFFLYEAASSANFDDRYFVLQNRINALMRDMTSRVSVFYTSVQDAVDVSNYIACNAKIRALTQIEGEYKAAVASYEKILSDQSMLEANVEMYRVLVENLSKMLEETKVMETSAEGNLLVIDEAVPAKLPFAPNKMKLCAIGALMGLILSCGICFMYYITDNTIYSEADIKQQLGDSVQSLGWIPYKSVSTKKKKKDDNGVPLLINKASSYVSERYWILSSNISLAAPDAKVFVFNSMSMGEGKSTVTCNIAATVASLGLKVLIIDCDMRRSELERFFNLKHSGKGFVNALMGEPVQNFIVRPIADIPNLHLLPCGKGTRNPNIIYNSQVFADMIETLKGMYDKIFIDCPPLSYGSDFMTLTSYADAYAFIVRAGISTTASLDDFMAESAKIDIPLLGYVFYGVMNTSRSYYGYGKYGYGKYGYGKYGYGKYSKGYGYGYGYGYGNGEKMKTGKRTDYVKIYRQELKKRDRSSKVYGVVDPVYAFAQGFDKAFGDMSDQSMIMSAISSNHNEDMLSRLEKDDKATGGTAEEKK